MGRGKLKDEQMCNVCNVKMEVVEYCNNVIYLLVDMTACDCTAGQKNLITMFLEVW